MVLIFITVILIVRTQYQQNIIINSNAEIDVLENTFYTFKDEYNLLYNKYLNLTTYYNYTIGKYNDYALMIDDLNNENHALVININELLYELTSEQNKYLEILSNYTFLKNEMNIVKTELENILNFNKSIFLEIDKNIDLESHEDIIMNYNFSYSGYLEVNFTSTDEIFFWFGSSIINDYYSRYPLWPIVSETGSFKIPVCKEIIVYIKNPNDAGININLSMSLYY